MQEPEYQEDDHLWLHRWASLAVWLVASGLMFHFVYRPLRLIEILLLPTICIWFPAIVGLKMGIPSLTNHDVTRKIAWCILIGLPAFFLIALPLLNQLLSVPVRP